MNVLSLTDIGITLADAPLLEHVTIGIDAGEKIGFVGRNGSGKSTFLAIVNGELEPDRGSVARNRSLSLSTLEQRPDFPPGATLAEFLRVGREHRIPAGSEAAGPVEDAYRSYCRELGLDDPAAPMEQLSGGMVRKASIARCLAFGASFVTLDEPTNHLDLDAIEWLEELLGGAAFGFLLVTHDRYFLDEVCTSILEIDNRQVYRYEGNYSAYLEKKAERAELLERSEARRTSILRGELEWLKRGPRARTGKDKSRKERIAGLQAARVRQGPGMHGFSSAHRRLGKKVLELTGVGKSYDGREVLRPFSYSFRRGERIGIIGPNGSGKTTFLNVLAGRVTPDAGEAVAGQSVVFGYFDQTSSAIDVKLSVIGYLKEHAEVIALENGKSLSGEQFLERFLFPRDMQGHPLERLSGGELRRLALVRVLATAPNFLLLDEPTNDLDLDTIRLLEEYLAEFGGCMLLVSHDRALLDRLTERLFVFDGDGGITSFTGNYEDYRALRREEAALRAGRLPVAPEAPRRAPREKKDTPSFKERQEYERLLAEIAELEQEQRDLEAGFQLPVSDPVALERSHRRYKDVARLLADKMSRWEALAARFP